MTGRDLKHNLLPTLLPLAEMSNISTKIVIIFCRKISLIPNKGPFGSVPVRQNSFLSMVNFCN